MQMSLNKKDNAQLLSHKAAQSGHRSEIVVSTSYC